MLARAALASARRAAVRSRRHFIVRSSAHLHRPQVHRASAAPRSLQPLLVAVPQSACLCTTSTRPGDESDGDESDDDDGWWEEGDGAGLSVNVLNISGSEESAAMQAEGTEWEPSDFYGDGSGDSEDAQQEQEQEAADDPLLGGIVAGELDPDAVEAAAAASRGTVEPWGWAGGKGVHSGAPAERSAAGAQLPSTPHSPSASTATLAFPASSSHPSSHPASSCFGCGIELQCADGSALGFVPAGALDSAWKAEAQQAHQRLDRAKTLSTLLCKRCHSLRHHSAATRGGGGRGDRKQQVPATLTSTDGGVQAEEFARLLAPIQERRCLVLAVVDALDFSGSFLRGLPALVGPRNRLLLALNKVDLLPAGVTEPRLVRWAYAEARAATAAAELAALAAAEGGGEGAAAARGDAAGEARWGEAAWDESAAGGEAASDDDGWADNGDDEFGERAAAALTAFSTARALPQLRGVLPISARSGRGVRALLRRLSEEAARAGTQEVFVVGAANAGKSTLLNRLMLGGRGRAGRASGAKRHRGGGKGRADSDGGNWVGGITTSSLPGTTLDLLRIDLRVPPSRPSKSAAAAAARGQAPHAPRLFLFDTPGLLPPARVAAAGTVAGAAAAVDGEGAAAGQPTAAAPTSLALRNQPSVPLGFGSILSPAEIHAVGASRRVDPQTVRLQRGGALLLGGLAMLELEEGRPFFATAFVSADVALHARKAAGAAMFMATHGHAEGLLYPPLSPAPLLAAAPAGCEDGEGAGWDWDTIPTGESAGRVSARPAGAELWPMEEHSFEVEGRGWKEAAADIVFPGLGWISLTGAGLCSVTARAPHGVQVELRKRPMMPYEVRDKGASRFTGTTLVGKGHSRRARQTNSRRRKGAGK